MSSSSSAAAAASSAPPPDDKEEGDGRNKVACVNPATGDIFVSHGEAYVEAGAVAAARRAHDLGSLAAGVAARIVAGGIGFPFKWKCVDDEQLGAWFAALRAYPHARTLRRGAYELHGYYPAGRCLSVMFDGPVVAAGADGGVTTSGPRPVLLTPADTPLLMGGAPAYVPFDREYNEIGGTIVDVFTEAARMAAVRKDEGRPPAELWRLPEVARFAVDKALRKYGEVTDFSLRHGLYGRVAGANLFKSNLARGLFELLGGTRILDPCAGWGCRLAGALTTPTVTRYLAFDPNPALVAGHQGLIRRFRAAAGGRYDVVSAPFEDGVIPPADVAAGFDLAFTSPPYFDLEVYEPPPAASGAGASVPLAPGAVVRQSIARHTGQAGWLTAWYFPMMSKAWAALVPGGHLAIYINDHVKAGEESLDLCFPMLAHAATLPDCRWVGVLGLEGETGRIRPLWLWRKGALSSPPPPLYSVLAAPYSSDAPAPPPAAQRRRFA